MENISRLVSKHMHACEAGPTIHTKALILITKHGCRDQTVDLNQCIRFVPSSRLHHRIRGLYLVRACVRTAPNTSMSRASSRSRAGRHGCCLFTCLPGRQGGKFHRMDGWMPHACLPAPKLKSKPQLSSTIFGVMYQTFRPSRD